MKIKSDFKYIWLAISLFSLILLTFHWFGFYPQNLKKAIIVFNVLTLILSVPCSLFVVPVLAAANHFLHMSPFSGDGIYLNTILLFAVGFMQWFWIARFWAPTQPQLQMLDFNKGDGEITAIK